MSSKAMLLVVIASMLMTLCVSYTYVKKTTFAASGCATALGTKMSTPEATCLPNGKSNNVLEYYKTECNATHGWSRIYTDKTCATENTTKSTLAMNGATPMACTAAGSVYETHVCGQTTPASLSVAVVMRFDASGCADAAFEGFSFMELDTCTISQSTTVWEKWSCNGTTLEKMEYSDSTCTTNTSALAAAVITGGGTCAVATGTGGSGGSGGGSGGTTSGGNTTTGAPTTAANTTAATTTADPNANTTTTAGGRRMHAMRRLQSSTYYKIYDACGNTKPTLPAGAGTVPSTAASSSGNMAGAQRFATMHSMAAALVAAVFVALS